MTCLPIIYSGFFSHELVDARAALGRTSDIIVQLRGDKRTYVTKHEAVQTHKFCELSVTFVYLSRSAPQTSRDGHRREHAVIIKKQTLKCFLDEHQVNVSKGLSDCLLVRSANINHTLLIGRTLNFGRRTESGCRIFCFDSWETLDATKIGKRRTPNKHQRTITYLLSIHRCSLA